MNLDIAAIGTGAAALVASSAQLIASIRKKDGREEAIAAIEAKIEAKVAKFESDIRALVDSFAKRLDAAGPSIGMDKSELRKTGELAADVRRSIADVEALEARVEQLGGLMARVEALEAQRAADTERWNALHRSLGRIEGKLERD